MNLPKTIDCPPVGAESTCDDPNPLRRRPSKGFKIALVGSSGLDHTVEIQNLLRRRLGVVALLATVALTQYLASWLLRPPSVFEAGLSATLMARPWVAWTFAVCALTASLAGFLWSRHQLALRQLRMLELLILCFVFACVMGDLWFLTVHLGWVPDIFAYGGLFTSATAMPPFAIIVVYGIFIPNTWRRCLAVVAAMVLVTLAGWAFLFSRYSLPSAVLWAYFTRLGIFLGIAGAVVIYGSHRIAILRQQALQGRQLGQYQLKRRLGAGGMGEVHLAEHVLLRRPCAIKLIRPERSDPKDLLRFEREVWATATLTHPNTVQIYDYGHAEDGTFYYVMEHLPGLTLDELVKRQGPLPPARAVHFLRQLCGALREAHAIGLIHRDIKPTNVIVCERGAVHDVAKLLDFGLVLPQGNGRDGEKLTQQGAITGTPAYMSPEQAGGHETLDARSDIYSMGVLAYFLLTGQPPFAGRTPVQMLAAHLYEQPVPLTTYRPELSCELQEVVLRCLTKNPAERFADAGSREMALAACQTVGTWSECEAADRWRLEAEANYRVNKEIDQRDEH
jgi:serine/threonine-protein kinase